VSVIKNILRNPKPTPECLANIADIIIEKHDHLLPKDILVIGYGTRFFDVDGVYKWLKEFIEKARRICSSLQSPHPASIF